MVVGILGSWSIEQSWDGPRGIFNFWELGGDMLHSFVSDMLHSFVSDMLHSVVSVNH